MARKTKTERQRAAEFGLVLPAFLGVLAAVFWWGPLWFPEKRDLAVKLLIAAPAVSLFAAALPAVWLRIYRLWMKLAEGLSWVMTRVILTVFFFLVLTPVGLVMRVFGRRPLDVAFKDGKSTYWVDKDPGEYTLERYQRQF